ncbi:Na-translocating system protein MpsC family protein [Saccharibacillus sp. CPCC 101409]|uniref:Na-translocating system protein MpsC family protein n=1 Tax=Saccharibacillus sp. CPCC 101409 TaxID=3058041 RepID=UPI002670E0E1|nr:Na-translocating system protein MpsC family protein [Saccharibacillus sp. CPCC 101409]MDO3409328.1 Na-translocating system protein MpsC family protein [Saccharibacillus sp. CPCC 101409]
MPLESLRPRIQQKVEELFANNFDKSPESIRVASTEKCLLIRVEGFLNSTVQSLIEERAHGALSSTRELIVGYMLSEFREYLKSDMGLSIAHFYYDWSDEDLSCLITVVMSESVYQEKDDIYSGKEQVHKKVGQITHTVEKFPDAVHSFWIGEDFLVIVRNGLLIELEQALIENGHADALRVAKRKVEKTHFIKEAHFDKILGRNMQGIYLDWTFELDRSVMVCAFEARDETPPEADVELEVSSASRPLPANPDVRA